MNTATPFVAPASERRTSPRTEGPVTLTSHADQAQAGSKDRSSPPSVWIRPLRILPGLLLVAALITIQFTALGYGHHWDEQNLYGAAERSVSRGQLLPVGFYDYPSVNYWLVMAAVAADPRIPWRAALDEPARLRDALSTAARDQQRLMLRSRAIFAVVAHLAVLWVYLAVLGWRDSVPEALLAAALLGLSWEFSYHARWVAPDLVLTQAAALAMVALVPAWCGRGGPNWVRLGAVAVGLACGSKYPGGLLLLPLLLTAAIGPLRGGVPLRFRLRLGVECLALFAATYLVTTPGTILEFFDFWNDLRSVSGQYATSLFGYTVEPGWDHACHAGIYLGAVFFSKCMPLAILATGLMLLGAVDLCRREPRVAVLFLIFPVAYFLFFTSRGVMVVRNLLILTPFMAILAACGAGWLRRLARPRPARIAVTAAIAGLVGFNAFAVYESSAAIRSRMSLRPLQQAASYAEARANTGLYVSPRVIKLWRRFGIPVPSGLEADVTAARELLLYSDEAMARSRDWPANDPFMIARSFGAGDVNLNYYPTWRGDSSILLLTAAKAREIAIAPLRYEALLTWIRTTPDLATTPGWGQSRESLVMHPDVGVKLGLGDVYAIPLVPGGARRVRFAATSPESCVEHTDGFSIRFVLRQGETEQTLSEHLVRPEQVRQSGYVELETTLPARTEPANLEIRVGPGPAGNADYDWCWISPVSDTPVAGAPASTPSEG